MLELSWFICGVLYATFCFYLFEKLIVQEKFKINLKCIILSVIFSLLHIMILYFDLGVIRPYWIYIALFITLKINYRQNFFKTLLGILFSFIVFFISELLFDLISIYILNVDVSNLLNTPVYYFIFNIIILIISIAISSLKILNRIFNNILNWYNQNEIKSLLFLIFMALTIVTYILYNNLNYLPSSIVWITNLFFICVVVFVIGFFKEKSSNNRITTEYDQLLKYVQKYEKLIEEKSKNQHEYKNQLVIIKGLINKTNKKALNYIDGLYKNETDDSDVELLKKLQYLPQGGLKGLIYYKVEEMINKKIDVYVDVSEQIKKIKLTKVFKDNLQDISKVLGVYLDNAIEATILSNKKYIIIEIYSDNGELVFSISNTYKGIISLNKVDKEGYTTKGTGKGYGLSLVKDIINHNSNITQKRELNGIYYVQKLYIKK